MAPAMTFGIGARLFLAFGTVAAMTVAASVAAWISFSGLSGSIDRIANHDMPAVSLSAELAEKGGVVIATAPTLIAATTEKERARAWTNLESTLDEMTDLLEAMDATLIDEATKASLYRLMGDIAANLVKLDATVRQRFDLALRNEELTERLRWAHADFLDEVEPMVDDARFNIESAIDRVGETSDVAIIRRHLAILPEESRRREAILKVNASGNLAVGLIARAASISDIDTLDDTFLFLGEVSSLLGEDLGALRDMPASVSLRQVTEDILSFASGETGLFDLRRDELWSIEEGRLLLLVNRNLVGKLRAVIGEQMAAVNAATLATAAASGRAMARGKLLLAAVAAVSLVVAVLVVWLYVGGNLVRRLRALSRSMRAIAGGDLAAAVPTGGADEISRMAEALLVFRDTAVEVEEANAHAIIDNAQAGLVTADGRGAIEFFNPTAARLFGFSPGAVTGRKFVDLVPPAERQAMEAFFGDEHAGVLTLKTKGNRADGNAFPMDVTARAFLHRQNRKFMITVHDVSERENAQQILEQRVRERTADLRATQDELVQAGKLAVLGQIATGVAHELNQPLAAIRSYAHNTGLLVERGRMDEACSNLGKISGLTERMATITNHLKTFAHRKSATIEPVDLNAVAANALSLFENRVRRDGVAVTLEFPEKGVVVLGDEIRLEQVLVNLLSNALDAMKDTETREIAITAGVDGGAVTLVVGDTGSGVPEADLGRVFDPFFTTKKAGEGLGLGLSISYNIVKEFGGSMKASRRQGGGTAFTVALKAA